jgi:hypothetical protein
VSKCDNTVDLDPSEAYWETRFELWD